MLLIGDAAGLARPQSGEGILPAVQSGLLAARVIAQAAGDYRQQNLADYPRQLQSAYGKAAEPRVLAGVQGLRAGLGRALLGSRWFSRHVLLDRWFLHPGQIRPAG
jgi:flavin-dependent dehydrogenase